MPFNILNHPEYSLSKIKRIEGMEGVGAFFDLKHGKEVILQYRDYAHGGSVDIEIFNAEEVNKLQDLITPDAEEILTDGRFPGLFEHELQAIKTGLPVTGLKRDDGSPMDGVTPTSARMVLLEFWLEEQLNVTEDIKLCKKGMVFQFNHSQAMTIYKPYSQENKEAALREYSDTFAGSDVVCLNEKYGIFHTPIEGFNIEYGKQLDEELRGKKVCFREVGSEGWKIFKGKNRVETEALVNKLEIEKIVSGNPVKYEFRRDVLLDLQKKAQADTTDMQTASKPKTRMRG